MANHTRTQTANGSVRDILKVDLREAAFVLFWVGIVTLGHFVSGKTHLKLPGHKTAFWLAPLLFGSWMARHPKQSGFVGALGGLTGAVCHACRNVFFTAASGTICGVLAGLVPAPSRNWRGALKAAGLGIVCGVISYAVRWVFRDWTVASRWMPASFLIALIVYPTSGALGGFLAWAAYVRSKRARSEADTHTEPTQNAFTLVELLIAVAMIGILVSIAIPNFLGAQIRAKTSSTKADFHALATGIEFYFTDNAYYPPQGVVGDTSRDRLNVLSTPVAYLKAPQVIDPFARDRILEEGNPFYKYSNYCAEREEMPENAFLLRYGIRGRAPDTVFVKTKKLLDNNGVILDALYDPTNGLRSGGDLIWTGVRGLENR